MHDESIACKRCAAQWQTLLQTGITVAALQTFYARYKYLLMSRNLAAYHECGRLLAHVNKTELDNVASQLFEAIMQTLAQPATRGGDANAFLHISGYLKQQLRAEEKRALLDAIENYRRGEIEFDIPAALLRAHFQRFPNAYIAQQEFLFPQ